MNELWPPQPLLAPSLAIHFEVAGIPAPQGSKKAFVNPRTNRAIIVDDNSKPLRSWRQDVIEAAKKARGNRPPLDVALSLHVTFNMPRPKGHYGTKGLRPSAPSRVTTKPDLDKLLRALLDAITISGIWQDDGRVAVVVASKVYSDLPGCEVTIRELTE